MDVREPGAVAQATDFSTPLASIMKTNTLITHLTLAAGLVVATTLSGCKQQPTPVADMDVIEAIAELNPTQGNEVKGTVSFTQTAPGRVRVVASLTGLSPGEHGFHIHETGDCSAPDATSAGGHFNPMNEPHGAPTAAQHHVGDLGNITANAYGQASLDTVFPLLQLEGTNSIIGRAVVVHAGKDDLTSQPSGDAGARVACGVIIRR